jgi:hypothetical protein
MAEWSVFLLFGAGVTVTTALTFMEVRRLRRFMQDRTATK